MSFSTQRPCHNLQHDKSNLMLSIFRNLLLEDADEEDSEDDEEDEREENDEDNDEKSSIGDDDEYGHVWAAPAT